MLYFEKRGESVYYQVQVIKQSNRFYFRFYEGGIVITPSVFRRAQIYEIGVFQYYPIHGILIIHEKCNMITIGLSSSTGRKIIN